jgi:hypothetical protein
MLSFDAMKSQAENELSALTAGILWITGATMILTPAHLNANLNARTLTLIFIAGIFCYETALSSHYLNGLRGYTDRNLHFDDL